VVGAAGGRCQSRRRGAAAGALAVWLSVALTLGACTTAWSRRDQLDETLHAYEGAIRWSQFEAAAAVGEVKAQPAPPLDRIKVTSYDVLEKTLADGSREATQTVQIHYYDTDTMREHTLVHRQHWKYDASRKRWVLEGGLPPFE
jgi:hypothetical protein